MSEGFSGLLKDHLAIEALWEWVVFNLTPISVNKPIYFCNLRPFIMYSVVFVLSGREREALYEGFFSPLEIKDWRKGMQRGSTTFGHVFLIWIVTLRWVSKGQRRLWKVKILVMSVFCLWRRSIGFILFSVGDFYPLGKGIWTLKWPRVKLWARECT